MTAVLVPDFDVAEFCDLLVETKANYVAGMPYFSNSLRRNRNESGSIKLPEDCDARWRLLGGRGRGETE